MKKWKKVISAALVVTLMLSAIWLAIKDQKECCLCNSFIYHAPCLIDLETGKMIELALYDPHTTKNAELAEEQLTGDTFSFVRLGSITGIKMTGTRQIELSIPCMERVDRPTLCRKCRKQIQEGSHGSYDRYILADLYDPESKTLISIVNGAKTDLRCYSITIEKSLENNLFCVTIQGTLDIDDSE